MNICKKERQQKEEREKRGGGDRKRGNHHPWIPCCRRVTSLVRRWWVNKDTRGVLPLYSLSCACTIGCSRRFSFSLACTCTVRQVLSLGTNMREGVRNSQLPYLRKACSTSPSQGIPLKLFETSSLQRHSCL